MRTWRAMSGRIYLAIMLIINGILFSGCGERKIESRWKGTITGVVVDEDGNPISGVRVDIEALTTSTETGEDGRFMLTAPEGAWEIRLQKEGYISSHYQVVLAKEEAKDIGKIRLVKAGIIKGRVTIEGGIGSEGTPVSIKELPEIPAVKVEEDGTFLISGVPPGRYTLVIGEWWRYKPMEIAVEVESGKVSEVPMIVLKPFGGECISIAAGGPHSLAICSDGTVWAWGRNDYGQLGDGTYANRTIPTQVVGLRDVVAVAAGINHSLALRSDGTVWAWGNNFYGQLGDGSTINHPIPVRVYVPGNVIAIAAGDFCSFALCSDGSVWAWGLNNYGQLGDGTTIDHITPARVLGLGKIKAISTEFSHLLALRSDRTVWAWGWNEHGQLGDGTNMDRTTPVQVTGLSDVVAIAASFGHSLALRSDGTVWAWGDNRYGQLGDGTDTDRTAPVQVRNMSDVVSIASGLAHSLALRLDGSLWAWGLNNFGQLGDGTNTNRYSPVQVKGLGSVMMPRK
jgi:hypothetical protein